MDEDEDVILGNSPLDEYLKEVSSLEFSKYDIQPDNVPAYFSSNILNKNSSNFEASPDPDNRTLSTKLYEFFGKQQKHRSKILQSCEHLFESSCLLDEDVDLVHDLKDEISNTLKCYNDASTETNQNVHIFYKSLIIGFFVAVLSILLHYLLHYSLYEEMFVLFLIIIICTISMQYFYKKVFHAPKQIHDVVTDFTDAVVTYSTLIDNVIKHLKEVEVINHGYKNFAPNISNLPFNDSHRGRKCLLLRNVTMDGLVGLFMVVRTNLRVLLNSSAGKSHLDYKEEYIALMSLELFSDLLQYQSKQQNDAQTTHIILDNIKTMACLHRKIVSEFIYATIFILYNILHKVELNGHSDLEDVYCSLESITKLTKEITENVRHGLKTSEKLQKQKDHSPNLPLPTIHQEQNVNSLIHSSELNLQAAFARLEDLKKFLEVENISENEDKTNDVIKSLIVQFYLSVDNAKSNVDDISGKLFTKSSIKNEQQQPSKLSCELNSYNVSYFKEEKPQGDILYEGESEMIRRRSVCNDDLEEAERALKESYASKKLMRELKTILSVKETPVGLVPFPLQKLKIEEAENESDEEFVQEEKIKTCTDEKVLNRKHCYNYDPSEQNDSEYSDTENTIENQPRIGLPMSFLTNLPSTCITSEEKFGSSDESEEEKSALE